MSGRRAVALVAGALFAASFFGVRANDGGTPSTAPPIGEPEARAFVATWLAVQNAGDFATYAALYAERFTGLRRSGLRVVALDRAGWLVDRERMFKSKNKMTVGATDVRLGPVSSEGGRLVTFTQSFLAGRYADIGTKEVLLVRAGGRLLITREDLVASSVLPPAALAGVFGSGVSVTIGDTLALTAEGPLSYSGYSPGSCNTSPPTLRGLEVSGRVTPAAPGDRVAIVVSGTRDTVAAADGILECDKAKSTTLARATVDHLGPDGAFRRRVALMGEWPCLVSVDVKVLRAGKPVAATSGVGELGSCAE